MNEENYLTISALMRHKQCEHEKFAYNQKQECIEPNVFLIHISPLEFTYYTKYTIVCSWIIVNNVGYRVISCFTTVII